MKKTSLLLIITILSLSCKGEKNDKVELKEVSEAKEEKKEIVQKENIYQFKVETLAGEEFDFSTLKGKKIMVVNTASECGNTPQYKNLQALYDSNKENDFVIVGFPANNFGAQEPGTNDQIATFCKKNFGVTFPMMSKISVKGDDMHDIYKFLTQQSKNGFKDSEVGWNFQKYLIDENGHVVNIIDPKTMPDSEEVVNWIKS